MKYGDNTAKNKTQQQSPRLGEDLFSLRFSAVLYVLFLFIVFLHYLLFIFIFFPIKNVVWKWNSKKLGAERRKSQMTFLFPNSSNVKIKVT